MYHARLLMWMGYSYSDGCDGYFSISYQETIFFTVAWSFLDLLLHSRYMKKQFNFLWWQGQLLFPRAAFLDIVGHVSRSYLMPDQLFCPFHTQVADPVALSLLLSSFKTRQAGGLPPTHFPTEPLPSLYTFQKFICRRKRSDFD